MSWQLSLRAKKNKTKFTKTKYFPQLRKVKRANQILSRNVHQRRNLDAWDCSSKKVGSSVAAVGAIGNRDGGSEWNPGSLFGHLLLGLNCPSVSGAGTCYQQAKLVLNTAVPDRLPAREKEMDVIRAFLKKHICGKKAGSLYLSGAPGTGKTACLSRILQDLKVPWESEQRRLLPEWSDWFLRVKREWTVMWLNASRK